MARTSPRNPLDRGSTAGHSYPDHIDLVSPNWRTDMSNASVNGRPPRKQLGDQIDRLDGILDGLANGLNEAVRRRRPGWDAGRTQGPARRGAGRPDGPRTGPSGHRPGPGRFLRTAGTPGTGDAFLARVKAGISRAAVVAGRAVSQAAKWIGRTASRPSRAARDTAILADRRSRSRPASPGGRARGGPGRRRRGGDCPDQPPAGRDPERVRCRGDAARPGRVVGTTPAQTSGNLTGDPPKDAVTSPSTHETLTVSSRLAAGRMVHFR